MLLLISAASPITPSAFLVLSTPQISRKEIGCQLIWSSFYLTATIFSKFLNQDAAFVNMGIKEIRTALKVDLNKHAREQPGLHVCLD